MASPDSQKRLTAELLDYSEAWALCIKQFLQDNNSNKLIHHLTDAMDVLIKELLENNGLSASHAVIATGGYGRRELFPYSDIDIIFLSEKDAEDSRPQVMSILYSLWELKLQIGYSVHTIATLMDTKDKDLSLTTALLDHRLVSGNTELYQQFKGALNETHREGFEPSFIEAKLAERDKRHKRFGDSRYLLEPNIKESKGGLRDLHTLEWLIKYAYHTSSIRDLVAMQVLSADEVNVFEKSRKFLWNLRAHMHIIAGKAEERLTFDMQQKLAVALGFQHTEPHHAVERLMKRYFTNARIIGSLTRILCAILEDDQKRKPKISIAKRVASQWKLNGFILQGDRISVKNEEEFVKNPYRMLELFWVASAQDMDIHPRALQWISRNLDNINREFQYSFEPCHLFMRILLESPDVETTLRRMSDVGLLGRFIPAFRRVLGQTQFNMYHIYTVDEHTLVAIGILKQIEQGKLKDQLPLATEVAAQIGKRHVLYIALFCHDIAKGRGGDHSEIGEDIGRKLALRFGFSKEDAELVAWLVRYHLLMSATAFKRDMNDPKTLQDFVGLVQTATRLRLLLVLTVADIRAVGPTAWNSWKGGLLRELYRKAAAYIQTGQLTNDNEMADKIIAAIRQKVNSAHEEHLHHYLTMSDPIYTATFEVPAHIIVFQMLQQLGSSDETFVMHAEHDEMLELSEIIVCTKDRPSLFADLCAALSLASANIMSAKIFTRKDGIAVDMFQIQGLDGKAFDAPDKQARLQARLKQVLEGDVDIKSEFATSRSSYPSRKDSLKRAPEIHIENAASNLFSVIEITANDRLGLLYDITSKFADMQLSIASAHISTYGEQAVDVFYVKDGFGLKIEHPAKIKAIKEALIQELGEPS